MKAFIVCVFFCLVTSINVLSAQKVFSAQNKYDAHVKVYVVQNCYNADLLVYRVENRYEAQGNKGLWFFTQNRYDADKIIFFTENRYEADLLIFFVNNRYDAGWRNNAKKYLMY